MAVAPITNSSSPGQPAGSNTGSSKKKYNYNYDFPLMYKEQSEKNNGKKKRFSLSCADFVFQAHLDPSHITDDQGKRIAQVDVLTGIVLQDFGYTVQNIEIRGTTGAKYYDEVDQIDRLFNGQSTAGSPTPATLTLEGRYYTGVLTRFEFDRMAQDQVYRYVLGFTVLTRGKQYDNGSGSYNSTVVSANTAKNAAATANGQNICNYIDNTGKTPSDYVSANHSIPRSKKAAALAYIAANWSTAPQNKRSYPGNNQKINQGEVLVVPSDWSNVLNSNAGSPASTSAAALQVLSGNVTATA